MDDYFTVVKRIIPNSIKNCNIERLVCVPKNLKNCKTKEFEDAFSCLLNIFLSESYFGFIKKETLRTTKEYKNNFKNLQL